jgi:hypothetical protein
MTELCTQTVNAIVFDELYDDLRRLDLNHENS